MLTLVTTLLLPAPAVSEHVNIGYFGKAECTGQRVQTTRDQVVALGTLPDIRS